MKARAFAVALALLACQRQPLPAPPAPAPPTPQVEAPESLYNLTLTLEDADGQRRALGDFRGQPMLISMFYGSCPHACPMLISQIKRLEQPLPAAQRRRLRVLLVSLDPQKDTPAALRALRERHQVDASRWCLSRTSPTQVRELAAVLDIKYQQLPDGSFNHSSIITLLDEQGTAVAHTSGLGDKGETILAALTRVLSRQHP